MSSHGRRERVFLEVSIKARQSSEDGRAPYRTFEVRVNDLEFSMLFRRTTGPGWWKRWGFYNGDSVSTPWFTATVWADMPFLSQVRVLGDYAEEWWEQKRWRN